MLLSNKDYKIVELFAGCGGMALGLERAGFNVVLLNEINKDAIKTLRHNRNNWNVSTKNIRIIDFSRFKGIDLVSGGFPCQSFSVAGSGGGFNDARGSLFFDFIRAIKEMQPKMFLAENVQGIINHDNGKTILKITESFKELGYKLFTPALLNAVLYKVPQNRKRVFFIGVRGDIQEQVSFVEPICYKDSLLTVRDALKKGVLYNSDVPESPHHVYPDKKKNVFQLIPEGGCWKHLPLDIQKEYMGISFYTPGGQTGFCRRLAWNKPCPTILCSPSYKRTERCHPDETRPLTIREYARMQTFPDNWEFFGGLTSQYKQIGNAVPVNLAHAIGDSLIKMLNQIK